MKYGDEGMDAPPRLEQDHSSVVMASKLDLRYPADGPTRQLTFNLGPLASLNFPIALVTAIWRAKSASAIFVSIPRPGEFLLMSLIKAVYGERITTFVFDLVMREPGSVRERIVARIKRRLLRSVDVFIFIHRDTSGYERVYGISREKCVYIPFKANNFDLAQSIAPGDDGYALSLGTSQRDYDLLFDAVRDLPIQLKIVAPKARVSTHGARMGLAELPINVERIDRPVDRTEWNFLIARSRFVVIPILPGVLQPAGISVYLEAMILGKPVIITRGASTEQILDGSLAVLVPPGDREALRTAIVRLWSDPGLRATLSENGKKYAQSLGNNDRLLADLRSIIKQKCGSTTSRHPRR